MNDLELTRRFAAIEGELIKIQKLESLLRDGPAPAPRETSQSFDLLPGLSLVVLLLGEVADHADRLHHLEANLRARQSAERRRAEAIDGQSRPKRPVGRPKGSTKARSNGVEAALAH